MVVVVVKRKTKERIRTRGYKKLQEVTRSYEYYPHASSLRTCMIAVLKAVGLNKPLIQGHIGVSIAAVQSVNCLCLGGWRKSRGWEKWVRKSG